MRLTSKHISNVAALCAALLISAMGFAQISPSEITDPQLRAIEQTYLPKLVAINRAVGNTRFPFLFSLNRYVGLDPKEQPKSDQRGLEFVSFHGRLVLKTTGNYNAAYNANLLTSNQRANKTFDEVVQPILVLLGNQFSIDDKFDAFGFEIGYHVRTKTSGTNYEGKENLVVVMDKADAFRYISAKDDSDRQQILNRAELFLNGKPLGLERDAHEPFGLETVNQSALDQQSASASLTPAAKTPSTATITEDDVRQVQSKYQSQLDALAAAGTARFRFVPYAPPGLTLFRSQLFLQLTLRYAETFDRDTTSIYRRAARSFDLFLAPQMKGILEGLPHIEGMTGVAFTILNEIGSKSASSSSEALEFFFPLAAIQGFAKAEITNQELINQGIVLVNGVRISLDLQRVE